MVQSTLSDAHRAYLRDQAITDQVMDAAGVRSVFVHADLPPFLEHHYRRRGATVVPGIVFPWYPPDGGEPIWELRADHPPEGCSKYLWSDAPVVISVLPGMRDRVADPSVPLLYVEGNKQVLATVSAIGELPYAVAGLHGCWGWSRDKKPSPELGMIPHEDRDVLICLDRDRTSNRYVWDAAEGLAAAVRALGARTVRYLSLPVRGTNGIDDYLATIPADDRAAVLTRLIGQAVTRPGARPRDTRNGRGSGSETLPATGDAYLTSEVAAVAAVAPSMDGATLLDETIRAITAYIAFSNPLYAVAVTLYAAATHAGRELQVAPRLRVKSPVKRCGKTRLLDVLMCLARKPLATANVSAAAMARSIGNDPCTLVLDEADTVFARTAKADETADALRGILNAGFERGYPYVRCNGVTGEVESWPTFAMAIIAGIGDLPDTIEDRSVIIPMARKTDGTRVARFRVRRDVPTLRDLGARLGAWVAPLAAQIGAVEPPMPPGMSDRAEDVWEPLIAVADAADGHWPDLARDAALVMAAEAATADAESSIAARMLADMRTVLGDADKMHGTMILAKLAGLDGAPWGDWSFGRPVNARQLAGMLRPFGIAPRDVKIDGVLPR